jgi:hypothetical protein
MYMSYTILKLIPGDAKTARYLVWGSIADSPETRLMPLEGIRAFWKDTFGKVSMHRFEYDIARVKDQSREDIIDFIAGNRAGSDDGELTYEELLEAYTDEPLQKTDKLELVPGTIIPIKINGKTVNTTIDKNGTQRLPKDEIIDKLFNADLLDLNKIAQVAAGMSIPRPFGFNGTFTAEDRLTLYREYLGYSVSGFGEVFPDAEIENPLWE